MPEGRCGLLLMMPKAWRDELHRQARQERRPTAKYVLGLVAVAAGLGGAPVRRAMTLTERLALVDFPGAGDSPYVQEIRKKYPGRWAAARRRQVAAERAAGAGGGGKDGSHSTSPRKDPGDGARRPGAGPNSGDVA